MKPGYKTTEFWLHVAAMLVGVVSAGGFFTQSWVVQALGVVASILGANGYQWMRSDVKSEEIKASLPEKKPDEAASIRTELK